MSFANPLDDGFEPQSNVDLTLVPASLFETPFQALGASGGTAAFFKVQYQAGKWETDEVDGTTVTSKDYWIGKDLSRARDEVAFYEEAKKRHGLYGWEILKWMTPYKGVVIAPANMGTPADPVEKEVMLLRNARDGYSTCRLIDIKIGEVTAVAGWQGKGYFMTWTQKWVDGLTNSSGQGFRLEGFDNPPPTLQSVLDHAETEQHVISVKKLHRFLLQRQTAAEFLKFFLDLHDISQSSYAGSPPEESVVPPMPVITEKFSNVETEELVLLNCIEELADLAGACRRTPVPQQWIGSSVMLAFDSDMRPLRTALKNAAGQESFEIPSGAAAKIAAARVHVFDWGRSELNTREMDEDMSPAIKAQRLTYWGHYCGGIAMLLYDCCLVYVRRFIVPKSSIVLSLWDRDVYTEDDLVGLTVRKLEGCGMTVTELEDSKGKPAHAGKATTKTPTALSFSVSQIEFPEPTRLEGGWAVNIHRATDVPLMDVRSACDGVVHVQTFAEDATVAKETLNGRKTGHIDQQGSARALMRVAARSTTVATDDLNPVWEETFELATLKEDARGPFLAALTKAFDSDGGLEPDPEFGSMSGMFIESVPEFRKAGVEAGQVIHLKKFSLGSFFPATFEEGFGESNVGRENMFMHYCFPVLDRAGVLGDAQRTKIKTGKEMCCLISVIGFIVFLIVALIIDIEFFWD